MPREFGCETLVVKEARNFISAPGSQLYIAAALLFFPQAITASLQKARGNKVDLIEVP